jgi:hypothetical protein
MSSYYSYAQYYYHIFCRTVLSCILMEVKTNLGAPSHYIYLSFVPSNEIVQVRKKLWK